jgi:hypothetical protein
MYITYVRVTVDMRLYGHPVFNSQYGQHQLHFIAFKFNQVKILTSIHKTEILNQEFDTHSNGIEIISKLLMEM